MASFEWHLPTLSAAGRDGRFALIILNQPLTASGFFSSLWDKAALRVAADGGANRLMDIRDAVPSIERLDAVIGDLDSLQDHVREYFTATGQPTEVILSSDQDSTDFGKAVDHVRALQPGIDIVAVGGLGGRVDQGLSQLHQLHLFQPGRDYAGGRMYLVSPENLTFLLKPGSHRIWPRTPPGQPALFGRHVGIVPLCGPSVISTNGLEWDVAQWKTRIGGAVSTSNRLLPDTTVIEVDTDNDVVFTLELAAE